MEKFINKIFCARMEEKLKEMPEEMVDLICCDPPFGMNFMGKDWDKAVPSVEQWLECYRVLKSGAFMFVQSAPRLDLLAEMERRIRNAGFITSFTPMFWTFATGFPKGQNISLALDKEACKLKLHEELGRKPSRKEFQKSWKLFRDTTGLQDEPKTDLAKEFEGFYGGYQPKPAVEVIIVAMKPMDEKTYIEQVKKNGKGGVWFDNGRIPIPSSDTKQATAGRRTVKDGKGWGVDQGGSSYEKGTGAIYTNEGRFPANLLSQDNVLDDGSIKKSGKFEKHHKYHANSHESEDSETFSMRDRTGEDVISYGDTGSYNRFFDLDLWFQEKIKELPEEIQRVFPFLIVSKPSTAEKEKGLENFEGKKKKKKKNLHPTVKPIQLYSYLVQIGSRIGDIVLDPFVGSGTTAIASKIQQRKYIGIEMDEHNVEIAKARLKAVKTIIEHKFWS